MEHVGNLPAGQLAQHAEFRETLKKLTRAFGQVGIGPELVSLLKREVCDWLDSHVKGTDLALGQFLLAHQGAASPRLMGCGG